MKPRTVTVIAASSFALAALAGAFGVAVAGEPTPAPSSEASPSDRRSATANGGWLPPEASSKKPEPAEWDSAKPLDLPRKHCSDPQVGGECSSTCSAKVLREWVHVTCTRAKATEVFMGVRVLAGPADDVSMVDPQEPKGGDKGQRGFSLVFPVRRGDRRTIEIAEMLPLAWKAWTVEERLAMVVSAMWLPNAARPVVTVY